ncbi:MAG: hypothetical protein ABL907_19025 [Hyphomicrobium sp.]
MRKVMTALLFLALSLQVANAATLSGIQGQVLVNKGNGFVQAQPGTEIVPGDRVLVQPGGSAQITYPNGAIGSLQPGGIFTVPAIAPAVAVAVAPAAGVPTGVLVAGGLAAAAGAGFLVYNATKSSSP